MSKLLLIGLIMVAAASNVFGDKYPNYGSALQASKDDGKPVVVVFFATWCGPCRSYSNTTLSDSAVQAELDTNFHYYHSDTDEEPGLAQKFKISSLPSTVIIDSTEKALETRVSVLSKNELLKFLAKYKK